MGYLSNCMYNYGNCYGGVLPVFEEETIGHNYPPMYYRFNRFFPRRRMWGMW